jgi:hypothetical protein
MAKKGKPRYVHGKMAFKPFVALRKQNLFDAAIALQVALLKNNSFSTQKPALR